MATNFPGPYEVRINYTTTPPGLDPLEHQQRFSYINAGELDPGSDFSLYDYVSKDGSTFDVASWVAAWLALVKVKYPAATTFTTAEIWKYQTDSFDADFQSSETFDVAGTSGSASTTAGQTILTFRSQNGGSARAVFMEPAQGQGPSKLLPSGETEWDAMAAALVADDALPVARDDGYFFSPLRYLPGQSERLFKVRYRIL